MLHRWIQIWRLPEFLQTLRRVGIAPFGELIDECDLDERRLLLLQRIEDIFADHRLRGMAAERVERGKTNVNAAVGTQSAEKSDLHLRIELRFARAPAHALQSLAGGLLLHHREGYELAHAGDLGVERSDFVAMFGCDAIAEVRAGVEADEQESSAPGDGAERRAQPLEKIP